MKKIFFVGIAVLVIAVAIAFNVNLSSRRNNMSYLSLANVEALAQSETFTIDCDQWYNETCAEVIINGTKSIIPGRKK